VAIPERERAFGLAMTQVYQRAKKEAGYTATRFAQMLGEHGGLKTAKMLLRSNTVSEGFTALWEAGRLDLTVEYQVLLPQYSSLFADEELATARLRLTEYGMPEDSIPGSPAAGGSTSVEESDAFRKALQLMNGAAADLRLGITETPSSTKYRLGKNGPSAWIQPKQGRLYFDLRTYRRSHPGDRAEGLRKSLETLSSSPVNQDMAAIPVEDVVDKWQALSDQVIQPFFTFGSGGHSGTVESANEGAKHVLKPKAGEGPIESAGETPESILLEISRRRNAIEDRLRQVLSEGLRYSYGQRSAAALIGCLSESRRATLVGKSYPDMWQALYFNELRDVVDKEWSAFAGWFGQEKDRVLGWLEHVNRSRVDAHAKHISDEDLAYLRVCFRRLEEALDLDLT
jgi:hypothetical protein